MFPNQTYLEMLRYNNIARQALSELRSRVNASLARSRVHGATEGSITEAAKASNSGDPRPETQRPGK